jgi:hypothetical protein
MVNAQVYCRTWSLSITHAHSVDSFGRVIGPSQRPVPHNTQDIQAPGGIRTRNPCKWAAADPRLSTRGHQDRLQMMLWVLYPLIKMSLLQKTWCRRTVKILSEKHIIDKSVLVVDLLTIPNLQKTLKFKVAQNFCGTFTATTNVGLYRERHLYCSDNIQRNVGREEETGSRTEACWVLQLVPHCSSAFSKAILFGG